MPNAVRLSTQKKAMPSCIKSVTLTIIIYQIKKICSPYFSEVEPPFLHAHRRQLNNNMLFASDIVNLFTTNQNGLCNESKQAKMENNENDSFMEKKLNKNFIGKAIKGERIFNENQRR